MDIFSRAAQNLPLTPGERAFLKLVEGFLMSAFVAALPVLSQLLAGANLAHLDYWATLRTFVAAFGVALLLAISKYYKAHGDVAGLAVGQVLDTAAADLQQTAGLPNDVKVEPAASGAPLDVPAPTPAGS